MCRHIAEIVRCSRDDAKDPYFAFCYGSIKKHAKEQNRTQFALQKLFAKKHPTAWKFILNRTTPNYKRFSIEMLKLKSELFIDGVLTSLRRLGIECLTVHDAVYFAESANNHEIKEEVIFEVLQQKYPFLIPNHIYLNSDTLSHLSHYMSSVSG